METAEQANEAARHGAGAALFPPRLEQALRRAEHHGNAVALLCIGIEQDGPPAGDDRAWTGAVAERLQAHMRAHDTLAQLEPAQFFVILDDVERLADVSLRCEDLLAALTPALPFDGGERRAKASIGVALYPQDCADAEALVRCAGHAHQLAVARGGGTYQFLSAEMNRRLLDRVHADAALRLALARDELLLLYQPLVDLQSGAVASLEALVRWQHPEQGLLTAHRFLPMADDAGLTAEIGLWVLRRACRDLRAWRDAGRSELKVAINVAPADFRDPRYGAAVGAMLDEYGLAPASLTLEITESALTEAGAGCDAALAAFKTRGLSLTLDDFGTGHSSLSNLKRFPFDALKIDASFIRHVVTDTSDAAMCQTVIAMAHHLGMRAVAEGVETESQCEFLRRNMCDQIQGYLFAPPQSAAEVSALLAAGHALAPHLLRQQQRRRRLLLVDDEANIVAALKRLLRPDHYEIYTANDGQQGLDVLAEHAVDVIVSDQRMPGMLGADFLRKAKQLYPDTIRIMLSGYTELQSVTDAVNEGAIYKFLTKPWEDELLRGHIADAFRLKEIADDNERLHLEVRSANQELAAANRRMEQLLQEKQRQITRDEISLSIARELLQHLPLPVIGLDDAGMIAFVNGAAEQVFRHSGALLGNEAASALPELFPPPDAGVPSQADARFRHHVARVDGQRYAVVVYPMGEQSASRGSLMTLSRYEEIL
jgi:EAL domain-containing protein (putative c-di-GMP-specific phosphodiesterase class I)/FixJ family two-component response regulator/GGDEF domain-containing protein